jgi:FlaA1/EpsC-like NDP-sugar epimerase
MILDMIEKNPNITQREMSKAIGIAVSMINDHISEYENKGLVKRKKHSTKTVEYFVTKKGTERRKVLNIGYLNASQHLYNSAKENIESFLVQIENKKFQNILLYGAGEVAQILLHSIETRVNSKINVLAIIDDDPNKQGNALNNKMIINRNQIIDYVHDGILISSYINNNKMLKNLQEQNYSLTKVFNFFDV